MKEPLIGAYQSLGETELGGQSAEDESTAEFDIEEVIESMKWGRFQLILLFVTGFFEMVDGLVVMLLIVLFPAIQCDWHLSSLQSATLSTLFFTGMLCGSLLWGALSDKYGRKPITYLASAMVAYSVLLCAFSPDITALFALQFLVGMACSATVPIAVLRAELIASKYRAVTIVTSQGFWSIGVVLATFLAWIIVPTIGWRYLFGISAVPFTLFLLTWPTIPESVRFLLISGQREKAMTTLAGMTQMNGCILPPGELRAIVVGERGRISDLFRPEYRRTTLQLIFIWWACNACYYGTSLATTELLSMNYCSAPSEIAPDAKSSRSCGCSPLSNSDYGQAALTSIAELLSIPIVIILADRIGRRNSMTVCQALVAISYFLLLPCMGSIWVVTILLFIARGFSVATTIILFLYTPEVYPTQCRAVGVSCCYFASRIGTMFSPYISQVLLRVSVHSSLAVYAVLSVLGALAAFLLPIETKGRKME